MNKYKKNSELISTKRNKGIEPISMGDVGIIGYNEEIHNDDSIEFIYKLPLGAVKRLIKSYYEDIQSVHHQWVYYRQTGSWEIRMEPYCNEMLNEIGEQLSKHGLNGKEIVLEVFDQYFKAAYEERNRFSRNHGEELLTDCKPCNDPECCCKNNQKVFKGGEINA